MKNKYVIVLLVVVSLFVGIFSTVKFYNYVEKASKGDIEEPKLGEIVGTEITYENIFNGVNQERYKIGVELLARDPLLDEIAKDKLNDMLLHAYFDHNNPKTSKVFEDWFNERNAPYSYVGENLIKGFDTVQETVDAWMNSPSHKASMLNKNYSRTGIAISGNIVVQEFAGFIGLR